MKLKKLSVGLMTAVLTAGLLASPAMASEVTDAAAVQNGTVTVFREKSKTPEKMTVKEILEKKIPAKMTVKEILEKKIPARMTVKEILAKTIRAKMTAKRMKLLPV